MITKRIIPCLDVKNGRVVKGVNFAGLQDMADPVEMARYYNASGADELVFYDITASVEGRGLFTDILREVASQIFIPLTVGGGINTLDDFDRVLKCGADKVSVNSGAIRNPGLIPAAAQKYGNQCVVLSADIKRVDGRFMLFAKGGRENTGMDALDWLEQGVKNGAGELVVNSIDTDGVKNGFDLGAARCRGRPLRRAHHRLRRCRQKGGLSGAVPQPPGCGCRAGRVHLPHEAGRNQRFEAVFAGERCRNAGVIPPSPCSHPVGAAHVRPATFPKASSCGKAAGRACPAPTA